MATTRLHKNHRVALMAGALAAAMVGLSFASVPLYRMFCQTTGFGGTTQRAAAAPQPPATGAASVSVRFDANTSGHLAWAFNPVQTSVTVKLGEQTMVYYRAHNTSDKTVTGTAIFNVTPPNAGIYFNKIQCFCFTEQTLKPGESIDMPVVFFVDPDMINDPDATNIKEITLSYTMYPVDKPKTVTAAQSSAVTITN